MYRILWLNTRSNDFIHTVYWHSIHVAMILYVPYTEKFLQFLWLNTSSRKFDKFFWQISSSKNFMLMSQAQCNRATDLVLFFVVEASSKLQKIFETYGQLTCRDRNCKYILRFSSLLLSWQFFTDIEKNLAVHLLSVNMLKYSFYY